MICNVQFTVSSAEAGERLDAVVRAHFPQSTAALVRRALDEGTAGVQGRDVAKGGKVRAGEVVVITQLLETSDLRVRPNPALRLEILFQDHDLVAVNKPAGMAVHPLRPDETDTLANALVARFPEIAELGDQPLLAGVAHRIDTDTSGVVLAARTAAAFASLRAQFAARQVRKTYFALVAGIVRQDGELTHDLAHHPTSRGRMVDARSLRVPERPMRAVTAYRVLQRMGENTLLEVTIFTGVTHQIRCQLALIDHPLLGDTLYHGPVVPGFSRHFLHAAAVAFAHPRTGSPVRIEAPLTPDLRKLLGTCRS
ncbi:MAG: RluA family pseudouridine synthase [Kiritimatiellia bacterium]